MRKVDLRTAFAWTCEDCGLDNFENGILYEMTEEDQQEMSKQGMDPNELSDGKWMLAPTEVVCKHCGAEFLVNQEDEEVNEE